MSPCLGALLQCKRCVPSQVLKQRAALDLAHPLARACSHFAQTRAWKTTNAVPVHEKQSHSAMKNYRPVSSAVLAQYHSQCDGKDCQPKPHVPLEKHQLLSVHKFAIRNGLSADSTATTAGCRQSTQAGLFVYWLSTLR